jgi:four helix bundle protein
MDVLRTLKGDSLISPLKFKTMFLPLAHTKLDVYKCSREFVLSCYSITRLLPYEERYIITQQIRRAAMSVHLNLAEGSSRKSQTERKRYYEIARGSIIEIDAALDICFGLNYLSIETMQPTGDLMVRTFRMLSSMIEKQNQ